MRESCFSCVFEYLEIVLILQLNHMELSEINNARRSQLKACLGIAVIFVFGLWLKDSFIGLQIPLDAQSNAGWVRPQCMGLN